QANVMRPLVRRPRILGFDLAARAIRESIRWPAAASGPLPCALTQGIYPVVVRPTTVDHLLEPVERVVSVGRADGRVRHHVSVRSVGDGRAVQGRQAIASARVPVARCYPTSAMR